MAFSFNPRLPSREVLPSRAHARRAYEFAHARRAYEFCIFRLAPVSVHGGYLQLSLPPSLGMGLGLGLGYSRVLLGWRGSCSSSALLGLSTMAPTYYLAAPP